MVHAQLEVVKLVDEEKQVDYGARFDVYAGSGGDIAGDMDNALGLCIDKNDTFAQTVLGQMAANAYNGGTGGHMGVAEKIRSEMKVMAYQTMSNHEMGALFVQTFRQKSPEFRKVVSPEPRRILRFCAYAAASIGGGTHLYGNPGDDHDIDKDIVASICGIEDRAHAAWDAAHPLRKVTAVKAKCKLVHDTRRTFIEGTPGAGLPHFVHHHGVLDVQSIRGAYFMTRTAWDKMGPEGKHNAAQQSVVYVYDDTITVDLLKHNSKYYPDLRTVTKLVGIQKVAKDSTALIAVYANELYGRIHSDDLIVLQNTPIAGGATGVSSYHVRGAGADESVQRNTRDWDTASPLYYFGLRADASHIRFRYLANNTRRVVDSDVTLSKSWDGTQGSIYQLGARFGIKHAHNSVLGQTLPMEIVWNTAGPAFQATCAGATLHGNTSAPRTIEARNPKAGMPTAFELAEALSRKGRRNEVGIALQKLMNNKQGDLILFDGA
jgi:hypothetical protein